MNAQDAPTQYIESPRGIRFAYRKIGKPSKVPLICHNHFRANMDWWDPELINTMATRRQVIVFDAPGVGRTSGTVPDTFQGWAEDLIDLVSALGFEQIDLFGYSMGARAVQAVVLARPDLVRRLVLAGASPISWTPDSPKDVRDFKYVQGMIEAQTFEESQDAFRNALFGESQTGRRQFEAYWKRVEHRSVEPIIGDAVKLEPGAKAQIAAVVNADKPENVRWPDPLATMTIPVLVSNGNDDLVLSTSRTMDLFNRLPNAQLILYPKGGHGFLFQYPRLYGEHINIFLDTDEFNDIQES